MTRVPKMIQDSVLPKSELRCCRAKARSGWHWMGKRMAVSRILQRTASSFPCLATWALPSIASGKASIRDVRRSGDPSGSTTRLSPSCGGRPGRRLTVVDPTHSSGKCASSGCDRPCRRSSNAPPLQTRYTRLGARGNGCRVSCSKDAVPDMGMGVSAMPPEARRAVAISEDNRLLPSRGQARAGRGLSLWTMPRWFARVLSAFSVQPGSAPSQSDFAASPVRRQHGRPVAVRVLPKVPARPADL